MSATATATQRKIWKVKKHGGCPATVIRAEFSRNDGPAARHGVTFVNRGDWVALITCPSCDKTFTVWGEHINGKKNEQKVCDGRCWGATGSDCECACAGESHGISHQ